MRNPQSNDATDPPRGRRRPRTAVERVLATLAFYALVGWAYIVLNSEVHPATLGLQLTHFASWPHEDTFGEICFATSFVCALAYQILRGRNSRID